MTKTKNAKRKMQHYFSRQSLYYLLITVVYFFSPDVTFATNFTPSSTHYQIREYGFGAGGVATSSSQHYNMFGTAGEIEGASQSSRHYNLNSGLSFLNMANVPTITLSNPGTNYDRLKFIISPGNDPSDTQYAIAISTDNFVSDIRYIKSDNTIGTNLTNSDFQIYSAWGGAGGGYVTGLSRNTTYYIKAKARQGSFSESGYGPISSASTVDASLTFGVSADTVTFANLNSTNSYTDNAKTTVVTTSTNAYNGYVVNARETGQLTFTENGTNYSISDYSSLNSSPTTWSGNGFGYTTNDNSLTGGTADRFTNGGAHYAGFTTSSPGDPVADHAGPVLTPVNNEQFTITYRVTAPSSQAAGKYTTTILYIAAPEY